MYEIVRSPRGNEAGGQHYTAIPLGDRPISQTSQSDKEKMCCWAPSQMHTSRDPERPVKVHADLLSHTRR